MMNLSDEMVAEYLGDHLCELNEETLRGEWIPDNYFYVKENDSYRFRNRNGDFLQVIRNDMQRLSWNTDNIQFLPKNIRMELESVWCDDRESFLTGVKWTEEHPWNNPTERTPSPKDNWCEWVKVLIRWIDDDELKYKETVGYYNDKTGKFSRHTISPLGEIPTRDVVGWIAIPD